MAAPAHKWGALLLNRSTGEVICHAAHNGTRWVLGALDLTKVSSTPYATIASVDDGTTCTLTGGHNLTSGLVRLWDTSAAVSFGDVAGTVAGDVLTVPDTTGLAAGDQVWRTGVSEIELTLLSGAARWDGQGALVTNGRATMMPYAYGAIGALLSVYGRADIVAATGGASSYTALGVVHGAAKRMSAALFNQAGVWRRALLFDASGLAPSGGTAPGTPAGTVDFSAAVARSNAPDMAVAIGVNGAGLTAGAGYGYGGLGTVGAPESILLAALAVTSGSMSTRFTSIKMSLS